MKCACGREQGQCVKGGSEHCPALDDDEVMMCPMTHQPCMTEHDEFCEDYGCAKQAGMPVED